jgi:hypothetical protein
MRRFAIALFVTLMPYCLFAVHLQYLPAIPVQHTSKLILEIQESLPVLNLATKGNQVLKFDLSIKKNEGSTPIIKLPLTLTLTLKDLFIFLNVNGQELSFDPKGEKVSVPLIQLARLLDKPLQLNMDSSGRITDEADSFAKIFKLLPALKELSLESLLNEMFFHLFSLCGQELSVGAKVKKPTANTSSNSLPAFITYDIVEINDDEVVAKMQGVIERKKLVFEAPIAVNNETYKKVEMALSGDVQGHIAWKRSNAMLYTLNSSHHYLAELKLGDMQWTIQMTISQASSSALQ